jgi:hypothetical protein
MGTVRFLEKAGEAARGCAPEASDDMSGHRVITVPCDIFAVIVSSTANFID